MSRNVTVGDIFIILYFHVSEAKPKRLTLVEKGIQNNCCQAADIWSTFEVTWAQQVSRKEKTQNMWFLSHENSLSHFIHTYTHTQTRTRTNTHTVYFQTNALKYITFKVLLITLKVPFQKCCHIFNVDIFAGLYWTFF